MIPLVAAMALAAAPAPLTPREVVTAMFSAFNRHDARAMQALYAPDARLTSSDQCKPLRGDEVAAYYGAFFARFPDVRDEIAAMVVEGEQVAVRFTATSRAGPEPIAMTIGDFLVVRGGRIVADDALFDAGAACPKKE